MTVAEALNERELSRYVARVSDRWPIERALLGGARADDAHGAGPQRERGPEYVVVLVSEMFDGVPWLERVYQCASLWDADEMGDHADVHCANEVCICDNVCAHGLRVSLQAKCTPLHAAAERGLTSLVARLLDAKAALGARHAVAPDPSLEFRCICVLLLSL